MAGNVLAGEAFRTSPHALQNFAGDSFVNTQSLHSTHKLVMQLAGPFNLDSNDPAQQTRLCYETRLYYKTRLSYGCTGQ